MIDEIENCYVDFEPHCHSDISDGKSTVRQNIEQAINIGLSKIAITEHGPLHTLDGVKFDKIDSYLKKIGQLKKEYKNDIDVLIGMEFNLLGIDGSVDIPNGYQHEFDWRVVGIHRCAKYRDLKSAAVLSYSSFFKGLYNNPSIISNATTAYVNAILSNKIDMISHIGYCANVDIVKVAKACEQNDTCIEINEKHMEITSSQAHNMINKTSANFILGSDSHKYSDIGKYKRGMDFVLSNNIPIDRVYNLVSKI